MGDLGVDRSFSGCSLSPKPLLWAWETLCFFFLVMWCFTHSAERRSKEPSPSCAQQTLWRVVAPVSSWAGEERVLQSHRKSDEGHGNW